jgi:hypothetical protein
MKRFKNFKELSESGIEPKLYQYYEKLLFKEELTRDFLETFGGDILLVENEEDVDRIPNYTPDNSTIKDPIMLGWQSLNKNPCLIDIAKLIEDTEYYLFFLVTNNAGGDSYLVHKSLVEKSEGLLKTIELSA